MIETKTIAETNRFIVLDRYDKDSKLCESYQSEDALERELIDDLLNLGYTFDGLNSPEKLLANVRVQLQTLNQSPAVATRCHPKPASPALRPKIGFSKTHTL